MASQKGSNKGKRTIRKKKKTWYAVLAPSIFNNVKLGETPATEPKQLLGRKLRVNLMTLTKDPKKQSTAIRFIINSLNGESAQCQTIGYEINRSFARRIVRKGTRKIDDSFIVTNKDGQQFRIKPLIVTRFKANNSVASEVRKQLKEHIQTHVKDMKEEEIFTAIIQNKFQRSIRDHLKKTYPVAACEIRALERIPQK